MLTVNLESLTTEAKYLQDLGQWDKVLLVRQKIVDLAPDNWKHYIDLGDAHINLSNWEGAIVAYKEAIALKSDFDWAWHNLSVALGRLNRWKEVEECSAVLDEINPDFVEQNSDSLLVKLHHSRLVSYRRSRDLKPSLSESLAKDTSNTLPIVEGAKQKGADDYFDSEPKYIKADLTHVIEQAALTIVSKNYLPAARVLCNSFLEHHPNGSFFVVLVDQVDDYFDPAEESFHLLTIEEINLPSIDIFPYQYTILELNTAVKPYSLKFLLGKYNIEKLLYIDPDIQVFRPLSAIWDALDDGTIALTPHMRSPFNDNASPSEVQIIQSGTYNLGFIGLKRSDDAFALLDWWMEKLYLNCVVDIARGLFTDQKWMDLIPAYFPNARIVYDPAYNVAYWNLHERLLDKHDDIYYVDGSALSFFHFSGYSPLAKENLSKHQSRHVLADLPLVKELCDEYGNLLIGAGYADCKQWPYAFGTLENGAECTKVVNWVVRKCIENRVPFPNPSTSPEEFCEFLLLPNPQFSEQSIPPLSQSILFHRPDVLNVFPTAATDATDEGFLDWLQKWGAVEEGISSIVDRHLSKVWKNNVVETICTTYLARNDLLEVFSGFWREESAYILFLDWLRSSGIEEIGISETDIQKFYSSRGGYVKVLNLYFSRADLQKTFINLHSEEGLNSFVNWLKNNVRNLPNISYGEILWFKFVAQQELESLLFSNLKYNCSLRELFGSDPTLFLSNRIFNILKIEASHQEKIVRWFTSDDAPHPLAQLHAYYSSNNLLQHLYPDAFDSVEGLQALCLYIAKENNLPQTPLIIRWLEKLGKSIEEFVPDNRFRRVSVAGYFNATTGMGQSGRSMLRTVASTQVTMTTIELANTFTSEETFFEKTPLFSLGWHDPFASTTITVANADAVQANMEQLPASYWLGKKNIGYWVWETEQLPHRFRETANLFDEIWTASEYSAAGIRACIDKNVRVIPHILNFSEFENVGSERAEFGLPNDRFLFGYFFDSKSVLERKNPKGVIKAFKQAFSTNDKVSLVLKVSSAMPGDYEYEMLKVEAKGANVIWIEETFSRGKTLRLMNCLNSYVSLHRSEGFGLTMAEAMALGKPVIASAYSGNLQFMDSSNSFLVDVERVKTKTTYGPYLSGTYWAEPDLTHAARCLSEVVNNPGKSRRIANYGFQGIREKLSPFTVGKLIEKYLL